MYDFSEISLNIICTRHNADKHYSYLNIPPDHVEPTSMHFKWHVKLNPTESHMKPRLEKAVYKRYIHLL